MKQTTKEEFEYSPADIEKLIYEDIVKRLGATNRARVKVGFAIGSDPDDHYEGPGFTRQILQKASVVVDTTK